MQATQRPDLRSKTSLMRPFLCLVSLAACTASAEEVRPPVDEIFFPTGLAIAPDESVLFLANGNSELRYDSGSISVIDLALVDSIVGEWIGNTVVPGGCSVDADHVESLVCDTRRDKGGPAFLSEQAGVRVGNFATDIAVQDLDNGRLRLVIPTRGDPSIAWADWDGATLDCNDGAEGFSLCDDDHRLSFAATDTELGIPEEPFGVFADSAGEFAMVTHLTTGAVTLIDSPKDGNATIVDITASVFLPDQNGLRGATGVAGRSPKTANDIVYVASRTEDRVQTFTVGRPPNGEGPYLLAGEYFFLDFVGGNTGNSVDSRGIAFSPTGDRLYLVNRRPPSLQVLDTSLDETGVPANRPFGTTDICRQASTVTVADSGDGERAYVTCFQDGQIYVVDPRPNQVLVEDIVLVGRGPYSVVAAPGRKRLYVTNFLEDTLAVIDITPNAPTRNRVVLRIGIPRNQR